MIESILAFLAVGTFGFWLILSILSVIFISCLENDHRVVPNILLAAGVALYWKSIMAFNWQVILIGIAIYLVAGIVWSVFKWVRFVSKKVDEFRENYGDKLTSSQRSELSRYISVNSHKSKITGWITFWPWGVVWTLTGDLWNALYDAMKSTYERISNRGLEKFGVAEEGDPVKHRR